MPGFDIRYRMLHVTLMARCSRTIPESARPVVLATPGVEPSGSLVARSLAANGLLRRWLTPFGVRPAHEAGFLSSVAQRRSNWLRGVLSARTLPAQLGRFVDLYPYRELLRIAAGRVGLGDLARHRLWEWAERGVDRHVADAWAGRAPCLYGFEHASLETFRRQKAAGKLCVLWQVIAHHRILDQTLREELEACPTLATPYLRNALHTAGRAEARKDEQFALADRIFCNSTFVRRTFLDAGFPAEKVVAIPNPFPPVRPMPPRNGQDRAVFLHAGTLSIRKGTHVLLRAWSRLAPRTDAELWLVGGSELPEHALAKLPQNVQVRARVPRSEMARLFERTSALVLPTLAEGRANVILMAMAAGVPVITTPNSGCDDAIRDGVNGWLVPIRDADALAERLEWCLSQQHRLRDIGQAAAETAANWQFADFARLHGEAARAFLGAHGVRCEFPPQVPVGANGGA